MNLSRWKERKVNSLPDAYKSKANNNNNNNNIQNWFISPVNKSGWQFGLALLSRFIGSAFRNRLLKSASDGRIKKSRPMLVDHTLDRGVKAIKEYARVCEIVRYSFI